MDIREEFEKSEHLKERLAICCYDENIGCYLSIRMFDYASASYLNGAWYAFQEQQKKIDEAKKEINNFFDNQTQKPTDREYCNKLADILELLK